MKQKNEIIIKAVKQIILQIVVVSLFLSKEAMFHIIRKYLILLTTSALFICVTSHGQNLVPNPGFEYFSSCPNNDNQISNAVPWINPYFDTPDFFNSCAGSNCVACVPSNWTGTQTPHSGNGYAGIFTGGGTYGREFIEVELSDSLHAGLSYILTYYVSLGDKSARAIDEIGFYFSPVDVAGTNLPSYTPQSTSPKGKYLTDKIGWTLITDTIVAAGGEKFMTIGNFRNEMSTSYVSVPGDWYYSQYYFDDIQLVKLEEFKGPGCVNANQKSSHLSIAQDRICFSDSVFFKLTNGNDIYHYWWDYGDGNHSHNSGLSYKYLNGGIYNVRLIAARQCYIDTAYAIINVDLPPSPYLVKNEHYVCEGRQIILNPGDGYETYTWQDGQKTSIYNVEKAGSYKVTVTNQCGSAIDSIEILTLNLQTPNLITPNEDGLNDYLIIEKQVQEPINIIIYNGWGDEIFKSFDYQNNWNAKNLPTGIFYYSMNYNSCKNVKGWVHVVR